MSRHTRPSARPLSDPVGISNSFVPEGNIEYYKVYAEPMYRIVSRCPAVPEEKRPDTADGYSTAARARTSRAITPIRGCLV